ncbi:hypothetical protein ATANTOWER_003589 [Ataeniobius toweri]|uniref:Uncharacterized protein n=1 Tax=Ataeniobius toweri TaxID=208326 RepID=A0ABU7BXI9_9TELE|nr:hypothetical protein [Ataeniobius toweri]
MGNMDTWFIPGYAFHDLHNPLESGWIKANFENLTQWEGYNDVSALSVLAKSFSLSHPSTRSVFFIAAHSHCDSATFSHSCNTFRATTLHCFLTQCLDATICQLDDAASLPGCYCHGCQEYSRSFP